MSHLLVQTQDCPWLVTVLSLFWLWSINILHKLFCPVRYSSVLCVLWYGFVLIGVYAASKAGLEAASDALRVELAHTQVTFLSYKGSILESSESPLPLSRCMLSCWTQATSLSTLPLPAGFSFFIWSSFLGEKPWNEYSGKNPITKPWAPRGATKKTLRSFKSSPTSSQTVCLSLVWRCLN